MRRLAMLALACCSAAAWSGGVPPQGSALLVVPTVQTSAEQAATAMLAEEAGRRSVPLERATMADARARTRDAGGVVVVLARRDELPALLPHELTQRWRAAMISVRATPHPEGFAVVSLPWRAAHVIVVAGNDARGELFGAGYLLRHLQCSAADETLEGCQPQIVAGSDFFTAPDKDIRGHQIGYRNKNNTYDAWTLAQFEQQIRDLAVFGANALQLIAPVSDDDATSVLYPAPPLATVVGISALLQKYGLDCDLYYPEMRDYTKPGAVQAELKDFEALVRAMPAVDSLHIPGGDPGRTSPELLLPLIEQEAAVLHRYHPHATIWLSAQGFDAGRYTSFYKLLDEQPGWLTGVFFGPQSRDSFALQRSRIPARYAMQFYPDIAHTLHAQFPLPQWDPLWALTEGREPICPRPAAFAAIYKHFEPLHTGFFTYSEGVNDDVNKVVFTALGWSSATPVDGILADYARYFLHVQGQRLTSTVQAIQGLEENWRGSIAGNARIEPTLAMFAGLDQEDQQKGNGRWESLLYRATYDDYVQRKAQREEKAMQDALRALQMSVGLTSAQRAAAARRALAPGLPGNTERAEHDRLFTLAAALFRDWGLQLSVPLYHAENWERGANLDRVDTPLTDAAWMQQALDDAMKLPAEAARAAALNAIADWAHPMPGALYDDLGDPANEPHLVRGEGWQQDPELYHTAIDSIADRTLAANPSAANKASAAHAAPWRLSWLDYAETLYETPLTLRYTGLDPARPYTVRVTYAGEDYTLPLTLVANGTQQVHGPRLRHANPETVDFAAPLRAEADGSLTLQWTGPAGTGGGGRGRQVAEVWLLPH